MNRKIAIITIIFSALLVGLGVSFAFGNTINPSCPDEVKQAIQNWDKGLDARNTQNQQISNNAVIARSVATKQSQNWIATSQQVGSRNDKPEVNLRTLFLSSLVTLTFNTPVHSQILVSNFIQKLFTVARHYLKLPVCGLRLAVCVAIFTTVKRYFEKIFLILLGLILPTICLFFVTRYSLLVTRPLPLYYRFHNLRL